MNRGRASWTSSAANAAGRLLGRHARDPDYRSDPQLIPVLTGIGFIKFIEGDTEAFSNLDSVVALRHCVSIARCTVGRDWFDIVPAGRYRGLSIDLNIGHGARYGSGHGGDLAD